MPIRTKARRQQAPRKSSHIPDPNSLDGSYIYDGQVALGRIIESHGRYFAFDAEDLLIGACGSRGEAMTALPTKHTACAKRAATMLMQARCDTASGAKKDRHCRRAKAERLGCYRRAKRKRLGTFGAASPVKAIKID
jgi:hypothetical protein